MRPKAVGGGGLLAFGLVVALAACAPTAGAPVRHEAPEAMREEVRSAPELAPAPPTPQPVPDEIAREPSQRAAPRCDESPKRSVAQAEVRSIATRTTHCRRLPEGVADIPGYLVETECPAPNGFAKLHVVSEDGRMFFAVERVIDGVEQAVPLDRFGADFNDVVGPARWYAEGNAPPSVVVIPIQFSAGSSATDMKRWRVLAAWDVATGKLCRTEDVDLKADLVAASATLALRALEGACECP